MAVAPKKLHGVAPHELRLLKRQPALPEHRQGAFGHRRPRLLVHAHGAGAAAAKVSIGINARVTVGPLCGQGIVAGGDLNLYRKRWHGSNGYTSKVESRRSKTGNRTLELVTPNRELFFLLDPDFLFRFRPHCLDFGRQGIGDSVKRLAVCRCAVERHGPASVARGADIRVERDLAEKRQAHFFRGLTRSAVAENVFPMPALWAEVVAHVLHNAKY